MLIRIRRISIDGMHCHASTKRWMIISNLPPIVADNVPMRTEMTVEITTQLRHRMTDVRAP